MFRLMLLNNHVVQVDLISVYSVTIPYIHYIYNYKLTRTGIIGSELVSTWTVHSVVLYFCAYTCVYVYVCVCMCMYVCVRVCLYVCLK